MVVDRARIARFRAQGLSWAKIAAQLGVGKGTVYRLARASAKNPSGTAPARSQYEARLKAIDGRSFLSWWTVNR